MDTNPETLSAGVGIPASQNGDTSPAQVAGSATGGRGAPSAREPGGSRRPISTKLHGLLDYATGAKLVAASYLLRLDKEPVAKLAPRVAGASHIAYSLLTRYELGVVKVLPMRAHLALDAGGALALAVVPFVSGAHRRGTRYWLPHVALGAYELAVTALSDPGE